VQAALVFMNTKMLFVRRNGTKAADVVVHASPVARPPFIHGALVREAHELASRDLGAAEVRRRLIPLAHSLGCERPSYSFLRDLGRHPDPAGPRIRPQRMRRILVRFLVSIAVALLVLAAKLTPEARVHEHKTPRR